MPEESQDLYDRIAQAFGAESAGERAAAVELALEWLFLAQKISKDADDDGTGVWTVAGARYWQDPDGENVLTGDPRVRAVQRPVTEHGLGSEQARHWAYPRAGSQWMIDRWVRDGRSPLPLDPRGVLEAGARVERREEARAAAGRPQTPRRTGTGFGGRSRWASLQASRSCPRGWISAETIPGRDRPP